jgi:hypothetical protein
MEIGRIAELASHWRLLSQRIERVVYVVSRYASSVRSPRRQREVTVKLIILGRTPPTVGL